MSGAAGGGPGCASEVSDEVRTLSREDVLIRAFGKAWAVTAAGFALTNGGMALFRALALHLYDPRDGLWVALLSDAIFWVFGAIVVGLVNAALFISWFDPVPVAYPRSSTFAMGLATGLVGIYTVDLLGWVLGLAAVLGGVVLIQIIDSLPARMYRAPVALVMILAVLLLVQTQTFRVLRARQTVRFVDTTIEILAARGERVPKTLDDLDKRLRRLAWIHGIFSVKHDPWSYEYHYQVLPGGRTLYVSWGADGLPGPNPAIDPGTPGADIDRRAAGLPDSERAEIPLQLKITPGGPSSENE